MKKQKKTLMKNEEYRKAKKQNVANRAKMLFDLRYACGTKESEISFFSKGRAFISSHDQQEQVLSCAKREKDIKIR